MGASATASVARASTSAAGGASASRVPAAPVVSGLPAYMTVVDAGSGAGAAQGRIQALQQQEQTDDRSVAEDLADRIGQSDARETMQAEDARQAAQSDAAQQGQQAARQAREAGGEAVSRASQPGEDGAGPDDGNGLVAANGEPAQAGDEQASRADGGAQAGGTAGAAGAAHGPGSAGVGGAGGASAGAATSQGASDGAAGVAAGPGAAQATGSNGAGGAAGAAAGGPLAEDVPREGAPPEPGTGAGALATGDLVLIDVELAEHQRWAAAESVVGEAGSMQRAEFIAESAGGGFIGGVASGAAMGLGIGLVSRAVPVLGPIIGGGMALHGLITRDWAATGATIGKFGEGSDTYDTLANTLASVSAVIDVVNGVLDTIGGIVGVVEAVAIGVAAGAGVLAFFTFGATAGIAVAAGELAADCEEIREGISAVTTVLNEINNELLNPCILLFRALHEFTADADPREIESGGHDLAGAAGAIGGALGGWLGGQAAHMGAKPPPQDGEGTPQRPPHETPAAAAGEGPEVHFQEPPATVQSGSSAGAAALPEAGLAPAAGPARAPMQVADSEVAPLPSTAAMAPTLEAAPTVAPAAGAHPDVEDGFAPTHGPWQEHDFGDLQHEVNALAQSPFGDHIASRAMAPVEDVPRDATQSRQAVHDEAYEGIRQQRPEGWDPDAGRQDQHWTKVRDATVNVAAGELPATSEAINANRSPLQSRVAKQASLLLTTEGVPTSQIPEGQRGTRYYIGDRPMGGVGEIEGPAPAQRSLNLQGPDDVETPEYRRYRTEHRFADAYLIPQERAQIQASRARAGLQPLDDVQLATAAGEQARWRVEGVPSTDLAQRPTTPWSGETVQLGRAGPQQMLLAPELLSPDLHARGLTVDPGPRPTRQPAPVDERQGSLDFDQPAVNPNQTSMDFGATQAAGSRAMPIADQPATRSEAPLGSEQRQSLFDRAVRMGHDPGSIAFHDGPTEFDPATGQLRIGPNVAPLPAAERPAGLVNPANAALNEDAVIGHEVIGHAEAALGGATRDEPWHEELQASARAALHTPDLPDEQRMLLLQDAAARRRHQTGDGEIYIDTERYGPAAEAQRRASRGEGGGGGEPSVIIDPSLYEPAPATPAQPAQSLEEPTHSATPRMPTSPSGNGTAGGARAAAGFGARSHQVAALFLPQVFGGGGEAPTYAQQQAEHRAEFTDDNQPAAGVERVNPHYSSPPGTPDQIVALQNEILNLMAVRARAEAESQHEGERVDACEENRTPIAATLDDTRGGLGAVRAHEQAVQRRDAANQAQQQRQQESEGLTSGYPNQATGLGVLSVPLAAWEGFTSLASHLPGSAGDRMAEMNGEARRMQAAFDQMGAHMAGADGAQPARAEELASDSSRIAATGEQAQASHEDLQTAADGAVGLQSANDATLAAAQQRQQAADQRSEELGAAADDRQAAADSLAAQMRSWAQTHHDERSQAIASTVARLQEQGKIVTESPPE